MLSRVVAQLRPQIADLASSIEHHIGRTIRVHQEAGSPPGCEVRDDTGHVFLPDLDLVDELSVLHELLHLRRYLVHAVPQVEPAPHLWGGSHNWGFTQGIDNAIEHLVIIPEHLAFGMDASNYWNADTQRIWSSYPWPGATGLSLRLPCFLGALILDHLTDATIIAHVESCLAHANLLSAVRTFRAAIRQNIRDKAACVALAVNVLGIPAEDVRLVTRNASSFWRIVRPLPGVSVAATTLRGAPRSWISWLSGNAQRPFYYLRH